MSALGLRPEQQRSPSIQLSRSRVADAQIGPARLLDPNTSAPVLVALFQQLDIFNLWTLVLTAIGVAVVARTTVSTGALAAIIRFAIAALFVVVPALLS